MDEVVEFLLYTNQVVGSIAALARCFLALSEIGLVFDEVDLKVRPGFFFS